METKADTFDQELAAAKSVYAALLPLNPSGRQFVLKTVGERLGGEPLGGETLKRSGGGAPTEPRLPAERTGQSSPSSLDGGTVKDFLKQKRPKTDVQRIACLAFFLTHHMNQPRFGTKDVRVLNDKAGWTPFANPTVAIANATRQNRFIAAASQGKKRITNVGEDVVNALPDQDAVKSAVASHGKLRKKNKPKAKAGTK
jgi:hypothetical protein